MSSSSRSGRCRIPPTTCARLKHAVPEVLERDRPGGGRRGGHRLHRVHDAPDDGGRDAAVRAADLRLRPHAWVKLWKHHAAQPEADEINAVAIDRGEPWLSRYGGKISSEWFFPKALQILREDPEVYARAERLIEAADWIVWQLTGVETRNTTPPATRRSGRTRTASRRGDYFAALDPRFANVVDEKMSRRIDADRRARRRPRRARRSVDGAAARHAGRGGERRRARVRSRRRLRHSAGELVVIMGTSNCHILLGDRLAVGRGDVRRRRGRRRAGPLRLRGGPVGRRRHLRLVRRELRAAAGTTSLRSSRGVDVHHVLEEQAARARGRARAACSRSTGGTATAPSSSTPISRARSSGSRCRRVRTRSTARCSRRPPSARE